MTPLTNRKALVACLRAVASHVSDHAQFHFREHNASRPLGSWVDCPACVLAANLEMYVAEVLVDSNGAELLALVPEAARAVLLDERAAGVLLMLDKIRELSAEPVSLLVGDEEVLCVSRDYVLRRVEDARAEGRREGAERAFEEVQSILRDERDAWFANESTHARADAVDAALRRCALAAREVGVGLSSKPVDQDAMSPVVEASGEPAPSSGGEHCNNCGQGYEHAYRVPDWLWARVHPRAPAGLLCPECCAVEAYRQGALAQQALEGGAAGVVGKPPDIESGVGMSVPISADAGATPAGAPDLSLCGSTTYPHVYVCQVCHRGWSREEDWLRQHDLSIARAVRDQLTGYFSTHPLLSHIEVPVLAEWVAFAFADAQLAAIIKAALAAPEEGL